MYCGHEHLTRNLDTGTWACAVCGEEFTATQIIEIVPNDVNDWRKKYDNYHASISHESDKVLIPNWFLPEHIEEFLGRELTEDEYLRLIAYWHDNGCFDSISDEIRSWVQSNIDEILKADAD